MTTSFEEQNKHFKFVELDLEWRNIFSEQSLKLSPLPEVYFMSQESEPILSNNALSATLMLKIKNVW